LRAQAARALGRARSTAAVDGLLEALQDSSEKVRWNAAEALGLIGHEGAVAQVLVAHLLAALKDRAQSVREHAAEALGGIGATLPPGPVRDAIPGALLDVLRVSSTIFYARLSNIVSRSLLQIGDTAVPALIAHLDPKEGRLSETAAEMLSLHAVTTTDPQVQRTIAGALVESARSREPFIARAAIRAIGAAAAAFASHDDLQLARDTLTALTALYRDASGVEVDQARIALEAIFATLPGLAIPPRDMAYVRPDLVHTLGRFGAAHKDFTVKVLPKLIEALYDDDHALRRAAIEALERIAAAHPDAVTPAIPALADRLDDDAGRPFSREPRIRDAAAALLRLLGTPDALSALERARQG
jgi:HEAT repeat protein